MFETAADVGDTTVQLYVEKGWKLKMNQEEKNLREMEGPRKLTWISPFSILHWHAPQRVVPFTALAIT